MNGPGVLQPVPDLLPLDDARGPLRVLLASLAPGGAERIVLEWLEAECARGRDAELAVLHGRRHALEVPAGIRVRQRGAERPEVFLAALARDWRGPAPVSTHLVPDAFLEHLWRGGLRTVPTVHNARDGWRNDPASWLPANVPLAVACAGRVRDEMLAAGCRVPVVAVRHRPRVSERACDPAVRAEVRAALGLPAHAFVMLAVGAIKVQKDHARAVEVLARVARKRDAYLVVLGGLLEDKAFGALDAMLDAAIGQGVTRRLRLPGWVDSIAPYLAASDALLNTSRFEGLSIAAQEALAAGVPVVATDVGGQAEIAHRSLALLPADADAAAFSACLDALPVRTALVADPFERAPRAASLTLAARSGAGPRFDTLFVTANLNAGGAQRSLVNLVRTFTARGRRDLAVAVCGESTHAAFASELAAAGVEAFQASAVRDDAAIAESLLAHAALRSARTLCFWNAAPGVKLLVAKFAPTSLRIVDVSPGAYSFEEMDAAGTVARAHDFGPAEFYARLDALVLKHAAREHPACRRIVVIPNGVAMPPAFARVPPAHPRFLVHGRIAPSKRLETVIEAFRIVAAGHLRAELEFVGAAEPRHGGYLGQLESLSLGLAVRFRGADFSLGVLRERWTATVVLGTHQGSPNAVLEAMAHAIPVIANDSGGTREVVADGDTGWLLPEAASVEAVARAMAQAADEPGEAARRAARGRALVAQRHGLDAMAEAYDALLAAPTGREKMAPWPSNSVPAARAVSSSAPSPTTATT